MSGPQTIPPSTLYDVIPYSDHPYSFTHPRHMEVMAALFGMTSPAITRCRVLEIGCAAGANLIPQAVELPESRFVGLDLSSRQIDEGRRTIQSLGLENIELRAANLMDVDASWGAFDYIIAHGVFSWVPPEVQDKLLDVCKRNLSPQGVAFISYNTLPGWHLARVVRDMMQYHVAAIADPWEKIAQAKGILELAASVVPAESAVGKLFREEQEVIANANDDHYLFHDHLEQDNHALYFHEFIARAESRGLQYLAETDLRSMLLQHLPAQTHAPLARAGLLEREQYMDFFRPRRFRKTLVCHQGIELDRRLSPQVMRGLHFALAGLFEPVEVDIRTEAVAEFKFEKGRISTGDRLSKAAVIYLREVHPQFVSFGQIHATARARIAGGFRPLRAGDLANSQETLAGDLLAGVGMGLFDACVHPPRCTKRISERPVVSPLVRHQAECRSRYITNQRHQTSPLDPLTRRILFRLDGKHDQAALTSCVKEAIAADEVKLHCGDQLITNPDSKTLCDIVARILAQASAAALLIQ